MTAPAEWPPAEPLALDNGYEPDPFQKHAILGIHAGDHVFVTAKTGSGKTFVGEYLIARALARGERVFYTTPIKSLSNQKYHDLKKLFPTATVGILTGDIKMQPDAQIVVMTAEILRNLLYKRGTATESVGLTAAVSLEGVTGVVIDEAHYIQDPDRGHVWEETLILCPPTIQLVLLSATMPSATSLAGWLGNLHHRRVWLLNTTYRVVPLEHGVLRHVPTASDPAAMEVSVFLDATNRWSSDGYSSWLRDRKAVADAADKHKRRVDAGRGGGGVSGGAGAYWSRAEHDKAHDAKSAALRAGKVTVLSPIARLRRTVAWLRDTGNLPALFFLFNRRECESFAAQMEGSFLDSSDSAAVTHIVDFHLSRHRDVLEKLPQFHQIRELLQRGIAFHHSGLMPVLKEIVEIVYTRGLVRLLFATETFAVGLNMPTKTVIFLDLKKFTDGGEHRLLRPDEYIQMAGRAGRRGKDTRGLVLYEPMREPVDPSELRAVVGGALPPLESRMRFHYEFILRRSGGSVSVVDQSYWALQQRENRAAAATELAAKEASAAAMAATFSAEETAAFEERDRLEAALEGASGAAWRRARTAFQQWRDDHSKVRWVDVCRRADEHRRLIQEIAALKREIETWDATPLLNVGPQETCLRKWGFLEDGGSATLLGQCASDHPPERVPLVTLLGQCASESAEGHCILMPLLAASGKAADLTAAELACVLAGFLNEKVTASGRDEPTLGDAGLRAEALDVLYWLDDRTQALMADEEAAGVCSPADFWRLSAAWVVIVSRWIAGAGLAEIAAEFNLYEGNVQRGLLRVANILEEWAVICELRRDLAGLEKVRSSRFLRDEIVTDSLYLRL